MCQVSQEVFNSQSRTRERLETRVAVEGDEDESDD